MSAIAASLLLSPRLTSALSSSSSSFLIIGISAPRSATDVPPELSLYITGLMLLDTLFHVRSATVRVLLLQRVSGAPPACVCTSAASDGCTQYRSDVRFSVMGLVGSLATLAYP